MDYGPSDTSTTSLSTNQFPISEVYVPNDALRALEGGPVTIDGSSKKSSPISVYGKAGTFVDGSDATQGLKADTAATDSTSSWSVVALLKGLYAKLAGTLTVSGIVTTSGTVTEANSAAIKADLDTLATNTADLLADGEHLAAIDTSTARIPAQGQALAGASMPVVLTAAQQTALTPPAAITGFALEAGHLATIDSHIPAQGQALAGASMPVVLPAAQITTLTPPAAITNFANETGGNLATLASIVTLSKAATKAASGDFADGSIVAIGTTTQTKATDGSVTSWSVIQLLKGILDKLLNSIAVTVASLPALPAHQSTNVDQLNGTTADTNSGVKSAGTLRVVLATDQPALTNKLLVTPDSVALPANQSVNNSQVNGTTMDTNSGTKSAGTQRIVIATDQPALTNAQPANVTQVAGNAIAVGNNAMPTLPVAAQGYVAAYGSNAAALTSSTDYSFKWGAGGTTQVNHVMIQNNTTSNLNYELDVAATAGSPVLAPGQVVFFDVQTLILHLFQAGTPNVGGSSSGNIVVKGWL